MILVIGGLERQEGYTKASGIVATGRWFLPEAGAIKVEFFNTSEMEKGICRAEI